VDLADVDAVVLIDDLGVAPTLQGDDRPPILVMVPLADTRLREHAERLDVDAVVFRPARRRSLRQAIEATVMGPVEEKGLFTVFDPTMGERLPASILVGEDNPVNQKVAVTVLERLGYAPDLAGSGEDVLSALDRRQYDIVFLDLHMPGMDGLQTARTIRREFPSRDQPWIVALTASVSREQRQVTRDAGMDDFVAKPFDVQTLMAAIERWGTSRGMLEGELPAEQSREESFWDQLNEMFQNSPERLIGLIEQHLENGKELVADVVRGAEENDAASVRVNAHSLKSSAAQFGSTTVSEVARRIEARASAGELPEAAADIERLQAEWELAEERLAGEILRLQDSSGT
jgi:CheY-like chemotaxis protein/HPt (histidine-containing phosphotransfer) domain-containing protein